MELKLKDKIKTVKVKDLKECELNARVHSDEQIILLEKSYRNYGYVQPIIIHEGVIVAGHARVMAAQKAGIKEIDAVDLTGHITKQQAQELNIADNKLASISTWDFDMLAKQIEGLGDIDIADLGFTTSEVDFILDDTEVDFDEQEGGDNSIPETTPSSQKLTITFTQEQYDDFRERVEAVYQDNGSRDNYMMLMSLLSAYEGK